MQPANWAPRRVRIRQRRCLGWPKLRRRPKLHSRMSLPNVKERRFSKRMRDPFSQAGNRAFRVLAPRSSRKPPISSKHGPELTSRRNWRRRFRPPSQTRFSEKAIWPSPGRNAPQLSRYWKRSSARSLGVSAASQEDCEVRTGASPGGHGSSRGQQNGFCGHDAECGQGFTPFSKSSRRRRDSGRFVRHRRGSNNRGWVAHLLTGVAALSVGNRRQGPALVFAGGVGPRLSLHVERVEILVQAFVRRLLGVDRAADGFAGTAPLIAAARFPPRSTARRTRIRFRAYRLQRALPSSSKGAAVRRTRIRHRERGWRSLYRDTGGRGPIRLSYPAGSSFDTCATDHVIFQVEDRVRVMSGFRHPHYCRGDRRLKADR